MGDSDVRSSSPVDEKAAVGAAKAAARPQLRTGSSNPNMNGPLYMQTSGNVVLVRKLKRKEEGTWRQLARWFVENQVGTLGPDGTSIHPHLSSKTLCNGRLCPSWFRIPAPFLPLVPPTTVALSWLT